MWEGSQGDSHWVLEWKQPGVLEEQEGGQSGWGVHRECWNSVKGGQEGKKGKSQRPCIQTTEQPNTYTPYDHCRYLYSIVTAIPTYMVAVIIS